MLNKNNKYNFKEWALNELEINKISVKEEEYKAFKDFIESIENLDATRIEKIIFRLYNRLPLSYVRESEFNTNINKVDDIIYKQCDRYELLYLLTKPNCPKIYIDYGRYSFLIHGTCKEIPDNADKVILSNLMAKVYPIKFPYFPSNKKINVEVTYQVIDESYIIHLHTMSNENNIIPINKYFIYNNKAKMFKQITQIEYNKLTCR